MSKPVKDFESFERKYGGSSHQLHGLGKPSIYSKIGHKKRVPKRAKIGQVTTFSKLPQVARYRSNVPRGWYGDSYRHSLSAMGIRNSLEKATMPTTNEFVLNKPRMSVPLVTKTLGEKMIESGQNIRLAQEGYGKFREEATVAGATAPPTLREAGYSAKYVTPANVSFYGTKTGQAIKFIGGKLGEMKANRERKEKEKRYRIAQERAEKARIQQLEIQAELNEKKTDALKKRRDGGVSELAREVEERDQNRKIAEEVMEKQRVSPKIRETQAQIAKDYASV